MGDALVVACRRHAVVLAQGVKAAGQVVLCGLVEVLEGRRQAVGAMDRRDPTERPEGILQALGQGHIALAAQNHMGVLEAAIGEPEMIQAMIKGGAGDGHA